ncbi:MAG: hypothetical protein J2P17_32450 [Mycobacterium sp.]|nr:hypothetical protein [Mycobacterium sp.]
MTRLPVAHVDYSAHQSYQRRAKTGQRPPCADVPDNWDLDAGTPEAWHSAVRTCLHCPLLTQCQQLAQSLIDRGDGPRAMIWAGVAYDNAGHVVVDLDRHRTVPLDHKRPMRIIRNGARPTQISSAPTVPRRHLVLGQPLRATGTDG